MSNCVKSIDLLCIECEPPNMTSRVCILYNGENTFAIDFNPEEFSEDGQFIEQVKQYAERILNEGGDVESLLWVYLFLFYYFYL